MTTEEKQTAKEEGEFIRKEFQSITGEVIYLDALNDFINKGYKEIVEIYLSELRCQLAGKLTENYE